MKVMLYRPSAEELRGQYRYATEAEPVTGPKADEYPFMPTMVAVPAVDRNDWEALPIGLRTALSSLNRIGQQPTHQVGRLHL